MRKRRYFFLLLLAVAVLVAVIAFAVFLDREPEYGGKKLSEWVETYDYDYRIWHFDRNEPHKADEPIRQIGTNAVPYLLRWMGYETPRWERKLWRALKPVVPSLINAWERSEEQKQRGASCSVCALMALGPRANGAVGPLAKIASWRMETRTAF